MKTSEIQKAAYKYAEKQFEQSYASLTRNEAKRDFDNTMADFKAGANFILKKETSKSSIPKIKWLPRYSDTMEDDKQGRWARIAYAGRFDGGLPFYRGKPSRWDIAWISKFNNDGNSCELKYIVTYQFPSKGKFLFKTLEEAKKEVETTFRWFMKRCNN